MHNRGIYKEKFLDDRAEFMGPPKLGSSEYYQQRWEIELPFDDKGSYVRHQEIRQLFEEASWKRRKEKQPAGDFQFFIAVFGADWRAARARFTAFQHDVSTCPEEVLEMVRTYINPPKEQF